MKQSIVIIFGGFLSEIEILNTAAVGRVFDLARIIYRSGYYPIIVGLSHNETKAKKYDFCECYIVEKKQKVGIKNRLKGIRNFDRLLKKILKEIVVKNDVRCVFYQSAFTRMIVSSYNIMKKRHIPLGTIANDWYEYVGKIIPFLDSEIAWRFIYPHFKNFIVTSRYFEKYFEKKGKSILRIPGVFNYEDIVLEEWQHDPHDVVQIAYAGNMQNLKDRTDLVIRAMWQMKQTNESGVVLHLFGNTYEQVKGLMGIDEYMIDDLKANIKFYGFMEKEELRKRLSKMDFTILIRPHMRYAEAGFATKFAESLVLGVPVIANLTSDMGMYLEDEKNGLIVKNDSIEEIKNTLRRAVVLTYEQRKKMHENASRMGREYFDLDNYIEDMRNFIENINI